MLPEVSPKAKLSGFLKAHAVKRHQAAGKYQPSGL
jgi:hypothetical protein